MKSRLRHRLLPSKALFHYYYFALYQFDCVCVYVDWVCTTQNCLPCQSIHIDFSNSRKMQPSEKRKGLVRYYEYFHFSPNKGIAVLTCPSFSHFERSHKVLRFNLKHRKTTGEKKQLYISLNCQCLIVTSPLEIRCWDACYISIPPTTRLLDWKLKCVHALLCVHGHRINCVCDFMCKSCQTNRIIGASRVSPSFRLKNACLQTQFTDTSHVHGERGGREEALDLTKAV